MSDTKECPYCGEEIKAGAIKCKHCQSMLGGSEAPFKTKPIHQTQQNTYQTSPQDKGSKGIWKKWWVWAIVVFGVLFLIVLTSPGSDNETVKTTSNADSSSETRSTTETDNTETANSTSNSRSNPAGLNEKFIVEKDDWLLGNVKYEVTLLETVLGNKAWEMVKAANMFNSAPDTGKEYILAKFKVKIISTEEDEPYDLNHAKFSVISGSGIEYTGFYSVAGLEPSLSADLYEGAEHVGWTYFIVDTDDSAPLAVMDRRLRSEIWFQLRH